MPAVPKPSKANSGSGRAGAPSRDEAEAIALSALAFLAEDQDRLIRFMTDTGLAPADLRAIAGRPDMLGAVLDYLLSDESLLLVFAACAGIDPAAVAPAEAALANADDSRTAGR